MALPFACKTVGERTVRWSTRQSLQACMRFSGQPFPGGPSMLHVFLGGSRVVGECRYGIRAETARPTSGCDPAGCDIFRRLCWHLLVKQAGDDGAMTMSVAHHARAGWLNCTTRGRLSRGQFGALPRQVPHLEQASDPWPASLEGRVGVRSGLSSQMPWRGARPSDHGSVEKAFEFGVCGRGARTLKGERGGVDSWLPSLFQWRIAFLSYV